MLSEEELAAFLAALLQFAAKTELSAAMCARALGISHQSMTRWLQMARAQAAGEVVTTNVYRYLAEPVINKLNVLHGLDQQHGLYTAIRHERPAQKVQAMQGALDGRSV